MPVRREVKSGAALMAAALGLGVACDSTVGLDTTRPNFNKLLASGLCWSQEGDFSEATLSVQILSATRQGLVAVLPEQRLAHEVKTVGDALSGEDFEFTLPEDFQSGDHPLNAGQFNGAAENSSEAAAPTGISFQARSIEYEWTGNESRKKDERLVVLLVDHSGSLIGQPDPKDPPDSSKASDLNDQHITFLKNLVLLPTIATDTYFSLVWFDERLPSVTAEFATPTRNRDVLVCKQDASGDACRDDDTMDGLSRLERDEKGATPLALALKETYKTVINGEDTRSLNSAVILFTDGVEEGDSSADGSTIDEAITQYANHSYAGKSSPVPVIVIHLPPALATGWSRDRDPKLYELACATGGEYIFVDDPRFFLENTDLLPLVANRLLGTWRLKVFNPDFANAGRFPNGTGFVVSTDLGLSLGDDSRVAPMTKDKTGIDRRLWFIK